MSIDHLCVQSAGRLMRLGARAPSSIASRAGRCTSCARRAVYFFVKKIRRLERLKSAPETTGYSPDVGPR
eukprot:2719159-Prymnesium_polylepis.1